MKDELGCNDVNLDPGPAEVASACDVTCIYA
jgi:hypothetical protein